MALALTVGQEYVEKVHQTIGHPVFDFFISFSHPDLRVAGLVHSVLTRERFSCFFQESSIPGGSNFVSRIMDGLEESRRLISVWSPDYFESSFAKAELAAAFARDPMNEQQSLVPLLVRWCKIPVLYGPLNYVDCVEVGDATIQRRVLARLKPMASELAYPGIPEVNNPVAAQLLLNDLALAKRVFKAQCQIRNALHAAMVERNPEFGYAREYEEFFKHYYDTMTEDELRLHRRLREHTETVEKLNRRPVLHSGESRLCADRRRPRPTRASRTVTEEVRGRLSRQSLRGRSVYGREGGQAVSLSCGTEPGAVHRGTESGGIQRSQRRSRSMT